jgi:hypothetical protein
MQTGFPSTVYTLSRSGHAFRTGGQEPVGVPVSSPAAVNQRKPKMIAAIREPIRKKEARIVLPVEKK